MPVVGFSPPQYLYTDPAVSLLNEAIMRGLFALLALIGVAGIVIGILTILHGTRAPDGLPFGFENYGGPGPIIGGLILAGTSLYLLSTWKSKG